MRRRASYEAAQTTDPLSIPGHDDRLAAQLRVISLLNRRIEGVHVDVNYLPPAHSASMVGRLNGRLPAD
jgi:hypothetical protein